jgi:adenosine deaminase
MSAAVDREFTKRLPKAELHAHLSGSIDRNALHDIWLIKRSKGECQDLADPLLAIHPGDEFIDIVSFFPLFDRYVYQLVDDVSTVALATKIVIAAFANDGVAYLELRTTPRENTRSGMTKADYVATVHEVVQKYNNKLNEKDGIANESGMEVRLILSVDRKMTAEQAEEVVDLAIQYQRTAHILSHGSQQKSVAERSRAALSHVVAVDLCGNPAHGE